MPAPRDLDAVGDYEDIFALAMYLYPPGALSLLAHGGRSCANCPNLRILD